MKSKANKSLFESLAWLLAAVVAYALTYEFDEVSPTYQFGPAAWPRALLIGVMIAAVMLWWLPGAAGSGGKSSEKEKDGDPPPGLTRRDHMRRIAIFAVPVIYVFTMDKFGFLLATPFFLIGYMYLLGYRRWRRLIPLCGAIYCAVVLLFVVLMSTPLPQGVGFFHSLNGEILNYLQ